MNTAWVKRSLIVRLRGESASKAPLTGCVPISAANDLLDAIVIRTLLSIHLRDPALESIIHCDFEAARAGSVRWIAVPDGLLPACAKSHALKVRRQEIRVELLV